METNFNIEVEDYLDDQLKVIPHRYHLETYGADYTADSLVRRMQNGGIYIPFFQRGYVWDYLEASRFIESLLLNLPVSNLVLAKDRYTGSLMIIDGQQRLLTLQYFYEGKLSNGDEFALKGVQPQFEGVTYEKLRYADRRLLDDTILPTTIISSYDEAESIFEVFLRLNTGGVKLQNQEIRSAVYHGEFSDLLHNLNLDENWRSVYGEISQKMRDVELILRFFALYFYRDNYKAPMRSFLNDYMSVNRQLSVQSSNQLKNIFCNTIKIAHKSIGEKAFRPHKILNASVFDSVMVGLACRLERGEIKDYEVLPDQYERLLANPDFIESTSKNTANEKKVQSRITLAKEAFESVV